MLTSEWRPIPNFPGYSVSSSGQIRSESKQVRFVSKLGRESIRTTKPKVLQAGDNGKGYKSLMLGRLTRQYVHRLVATVWIPNPDNLPEVNHKDGNKANNQVSNLEWVTRLENMEHSIELGLRYARRNFL